MQIASELLLRATLAEQQPCELHLHFSGTPLAGGEPTVFLLTLALDAGKVIGSSLKRMAGATKAGHDVPSPGLVAAVRKMLELKLSLSVLGAQKGSRIRFRCTLWRNDLPIDALPAEGEIELEVVSEAELINRA